MAVFIDRETWTQKGATLPQAVGIRLLRLAYRLSAPFGHQGISRVNRLVGRTLLGNGETIFALNVHTKFSVPSGDYYWSLLYNHSYEYEPELERVFRAFRDIDYVLIDLGANYGYWSVLVSSPEFGSKPVVAVEASAASFKRLAANAAQRDELILAHQGAVWKTSAQVLEFFGARHAGRSLVEGRSGTQQVERVTTITVADLVSLYADQAKSKRLVLKLDVEGVEIAAMEGAAAVLDRIDVIIFEESNKPDFGETFLKMREMTGFAMYVLDKDKGVFCAIDSPYTVFDPRKGRRGLQSIGFNFIAVRPSSAFCAALESSNGTGPSRK